MRHIVTGCNAHIAAHRSAAHTVRQDATQRWQCHPPLLALTEVERGDTAFHRWCCAAVAGVGTALDALACTELAVRSAVWARHGRGCVAGRARACQGRRLCNTV